MTAHQLDTRTALVVIDLQNGILSLPAVHDTSAVIANASALADAFIERELPVVFVTVAGGAPGRTEQAHAAAEAAAASGSPAPARPEGWADLLPELDAKGGIRVVKKTWGAFHGTDLHEKLQAEGVTQVVVVGIATSKGVESTARIAHEHGYNVTLATDAMTDGNLEAHDNAISKIFPALGETGTTAEVIALLDARGESQAA